MRKEQTTGFSERTKTNQEQSKAPCLILELKGGGAGEKHLSKTKYLAMTKRTKGDRPDSKKLLLFSSE